MLPAADSGPTFQWRFESKWGYLTQPHVRALAWLLDAPDLLDPACALWHRQIASLGPVTPSTAVWLMAQERDPAALLDALGSRPYFRLGLYAEKLMAFYFEQHGLLLAHGLQVRAGKNGTVGEFDFLLRCGQALLHWEFATKFYLLEGGFDAQSCGDSVRTLHGLDRLVGPNLADTLGLKMRKILDQQLRLGQHPAALRLLPQAVTGAQALIKGWLFYPGGVVQPTEGVNTDHCQGFWCSLAQVGDAGGDAFVLLPRMQWLAPWKAPAASDVPIMSRSQLQASLAARWRLADAASVAATPVLVAQVRQQGAWLQEQQRGFIVPDDWAKRAARRRATF